MPTARSWLPEQSPQPLSAPAKSGYPENFPAQTGPPPARARRSHERRPFGHFHGPSLPESLSPVLGPAHRVGKQHHAGLRGRLGRRRHEDDRPPPRRQRGGPEDEISALLPGHP